MFQRSSHWLLSVLLGMSLTGACQAGLFDDDEARRQLLDHKKQTQSALDTQARAQLELANQITALQEEIARLRGQVETLGYEAEMARKRQQDFYVDLDTRVRQLETTSKPVKEESGAAPAQAVDPALENKAYEAALGLFRASKYKESAAAFESFLKDYASSALAPNAQYWLGNAWAAQGGWKKSIELQQQGLAQWPNSNKAPDAWLAIANGYRELGMVAEAKKALEQLLAKFPNTPAGDAARVRLGRK